jgi:hypothetical protein
VKVWECNQTLIAMKKNRKGEGSEDNDKSESWYLAMTLKGDDEEFSCKNTTFENCTYGSNNKEMLTLKNIFSQRSGIILQLQLK